ncbi:hypothetical protein SB776_40430, partial [Burkholderia sp. SIMBA_045]
MMLLQLDHAFADGRDAFLPVHVPDLPSKHIPPGRSWLASEGLRKACASSKASSPASRLLQTLHIPGSGDQK